MNFTHKLVIKILVFSIFHERFIFFFTQRTNIPIKNRKLFITFTTATAIQIWSDRLCIKENCNKKESKAYKEEKIMEKKTAVRAINKMFVSLNLI